MTKLSTTLKKEFFELLPPTIFFFVALHIVAFVRVLMLKGTGISPSSSMSIAVAALILGKAVLIADMLPMINRFPNKPLIYNVAWKTLIYWLMATLIHYVERLIDFWRQTGGFVAGNQGATGGNRVAAFLGYPDHSARADCHVLHDARTGARDWEEKVLRIFFGPMPQHPEWKTKEPFASLLKGDVKGALAGGKKRSSRSSP
jgi:hypothetical protein